MLYCKKEDLDTVLSFISSKVTDVINVMDNTLNPISMDCKFLNVPQEVNKSFDKLTSFLKDIEVKRLYLSDSVIRVSDKDMLIIVLDTLPCGLIPLSVIDLWGTLYDTPEEVYIYG